MVCSTKCFVSAHGKKRDCFGKGCKWDLLSMGWCFPGTHSPWIMDVRRYLSACSFPYDLMDLLAINLSKLFHDRILSTSSLTTAWRSTYSLTCFKPISCYFHLISFFPELCNIMLQLNPLLHLWFWKPHLYPLGFSSPNWSVAAVLAFLLQFRCFIPVIILVTLLSPFF